MLKVILNIVKSVFGIILTILSPLKRAVCRRRKNSSSDITVPVNGLIDQHSTTIDMTAHSLPANQPELESWDIWGGDEQAQQEVVPNSVSSGNAAKMTQYYQSRQRTEPEPEPEPELDYFQDMMPDFKKTQRIRLHKKDDLSVNQQAISSRLAISSDIPISMNTSELGSWEETENAWDEDVNDDLTWQAEAAIREKRRAERQVRNMEQQRKRQEKLQKIKKDSHLSAVKLS